jgi:hypothetical protein
MNVGRPAVKTAEFHPITPNLPTVTWTLYVLVRL